MSKDVRSELSKRNKWHISKHKFLELKHFCMQYPEWHKLYLELSLRGYTAASGNEIKCCNLDGHVGDAAIEMYYISKKMDLIKEVAYRTDPILGDYIFKAVTNGYPFTYLKAILEIPCERDMYYDRYRKFFWLLSHER